MRPAAALLLAALVSVPGLHAQEDGSLDRPLDPVILTGAVLPAALGTDPDEIVAFRWTGAWEQVPVQVDERAVLDFGAVYGTDPAGLLTLQYTDPATFAGPDPDPAFDKDDELVLMARDTGDRAAWSEAATPPGVLAGGGLELEVTDALTGERGWVYLFRSTAGLDPGAGRSYVDYEFHLLSGDYRDTYRTHSGPNPEDSTVTTPLYSVHFSDRWIRDGLRVTAGGALGADILDRHRNLFGPGVCQRSEDTFSSGEGAFFVNKSGPVRAIRAYLGANSGPLTARTHWFYDGRLDLRTDLRVHPIPGLMDFYDLSADAAGMTFRDSLNPDGVPVDGIPDMVQTGVQEWAMVSGPQGTLLSVGRLDTDIPGFSYSSYYSDDVDPTEQTCTGDDHHYGAGGSWIREEIPNTDPSADPFFIVQGWRFDTVAGPGAPIEWATDRRGQVRAPLTASVLPYPESTCEADRIGRIADLRLERLGPDLSLHWSADPWADGYNVWYVTDPLAIPGLRQGGGSLSPPDCGPSTGPLCVDAGAGVAGGDPLRLYRVRGACRADEAAE